MDKFIIYVNYSSYEYDTYYHLICNGEPVLSYRLEKDIDELIQRIKENRTFSENFYLCIVQDKDADKWADYNEVFQKEDIQLFPVDDEASQWVYDEISKNFEYETDNLNIVFYGKGCLKDYSKSIDETLKQAEDILKHGGDEMTELARIIRDKYERMTKQ